MFDCYTIDMYRNAFKAGIPQCIQKYIFPIFDTVFEFMHKMFFPLCYILNGQCSRPNSVVRLQHRKLIDLIIYSGKNLLVITREKNVSKSGDSLLHIHESENTPSPCDCYTQPNIRLQSEIQNRKSITIA